MAERIREIEPIAPNIIYVGDRLRRVSEGAVSRMVESLSALGLMSPIVVRMVDTMEIDGNLVDGVPVLIAGATRLAAVKRLGWKHIDCLMADADEVEGRRREIAENLHRTELTVQERAEHVAEWLRLSEVSRQPDAKGKAGRPEGGIRAAARDLGINEPEARRAVKVASISERAKEAAVAAKLDNTQSALLRIAATALEDQVNEVHQIAAEREQRREVRKPVSPSDAPRNDYEIINKDHRALVRAWEAARPEARDLFLSDIGAVISVPVLDRRCA